MVACKLINLDHKCSKTASNAEVPSQTQPARCGIFFSCGPIPSCRVKPARDAVLRAVTACEPGVELTRETLGRLISGEHDAEHREVDLLIRSGGEKRLSDFLLWECAYAELFFSDRMWPDFGAEDLAAAVNDFRKRERRFGGVGSAQALRSALASTSARRARCRRLDNTQTAV